MLHILVVEDEHNIRFLLATNLKQLGHDIIEAKDGLEALHILRQNGNIQLVVTDVQMPHMTGFELLSVMQVEFPHIPVIISSAYLDEGKDALYKGATSFLRKPFSRDQLLKHIDDAKKIMDAE
jgi:CheY-like chemotaxis protein